jgi:RHS repeat-associated protein
MNARYQSPNYGIFISTDEVTDSLGQDKQFTQKYLHNPQGLNPYSYTQNDPVNKWDPDGRRVEVYAKELDRVAIGTHTFIVTYNDTGTSCGILNVYSGYVEEDGSLAKTKENSLDRSVFLRGYAAIVKRNVSVGGAPEREVDVKVGNLKSSQLVETPKNMTEGQFIQKIEDQYNKFPIDVEYSAFVNDGANNSNVFTTTILKNAGVETLPWNGNAPGIDPGYGKTLPLNYPKSDGIKQSQEGLLGVIKAFTKYLFNK